MNYTTTQYHKFDSEEIHETLSDLGFKLNDKGTYWQTNAIWRNGDNHTAIQIYKDSGVWKDYVDQTGPQPLAKLIAKVLGTDDPKVIKKYIKEVSDETNFTDQRDSKVKIVMEETFNVDILDKLLPHHKFYLDKNISTEVLKLYRGGYSTVGKMNGRYVFPIFSKTDKNLLVGFTGRHLRYSEDSYMAKWKHIGQRRNWLYPLYIPQNDEYPFLDAIKETQEVIIVESVGDSLALTENKMLNHMVTFGLGLSSDQICELVALNPKKIIIAPNNDSQKQKNIGLQSAIKDFIKLLDFFDIERIEIKLPISNDLSDSHTDGTFQRWVDKTPNKSKQIQYIIDRLESRDGKAIIKSYKRLQSKISFLKEYME